jgi:hypothetical protein
MRVAKPDWNSSVQINQTGIGLINLFTGDLFEFIDNNLIKLLGDDWVRTLPNGDGEGSTMNFRDPSILLKDLGRKITPSLRLPINAKVKAERLFQFYNLLDDIHGERHLWVHQEIEPTKKNLSALVDLVNRVATYLDLPVCGECNSLAKEIGSIQRETVVTDESDSLVESALVLALNTLTKGEPVTVGTPIAGPYLDHSYTLHLNGSIRDRDAGELLSEVNSNAEAVGTLLIARKPNGGRIRLVPNGVLAAYFDDHWGFLAQVDEDNWFPGHLTNPK